MCRKLRILDWRQEVELEGRIQGWFLGQCCTQSRGWGEKGTTACVTVTPPKALLLTMCTPQGWFHVEFQIQNPSTFHSWVWRILSIGFYLCFAGRGSSVGRASDFGPWGSNLPAVLEMTLGSHSSNSLTIPRCKIGTRPSSLQIHYMQATESACNGSSILALKPMGRVNWSPKQNTNGSTKWWHCHRKNLKKKISLLWNQAPGSGRVLSVWSFRNCLMLKLWSI